MYPDEVDADDTLDSWLWGALQDYRGQCQSAWREVGEDISGGEERIALRLRFRMNIEAAPAIAQSILTGQVSGEMKGWAVAISAAVTPGENLGGSRYESLPPVRPVLEALDLAFAAEWLKHLPNTAALKFDSRDGGDARRYALLLTLPTERALSPRAQEYFEKVCRLYVFGFPVEALGLCRTTIEAALSEALPEGELLRAGVMMEGEDFDEGRYFTLANLLYGASRLKRLDLEGVRWAKAIRTAASDILHGKVLTGEPLEVYIVRTRMVLDQLFPPTYLSDPELTL